MALDARFGKYAWVNDIEGWTVSVMRPLPVADVVRIYGGDAAVPLGDTAFTTVDERRGPDLDRLELFVQVLVLGGHTVTLEHNGWSGSLPEIARRCAVDGGWFFSVNWNVNAAGMVTQAVDGEIVAAFESLFPLEPEERPGERRPDWAIGPEVEPELAWQVCMAHLEQQTGVSVEQGWLTETLPTFRIPEPHGLYRDVDGSDRV